ncbi:unnamed protein product [Heligmosomoides polygyrus]|uniref:HTH_Tnp_Tc3_1 domain-containing protein n=1 Tax=Heligmosomoides polygyrus TaxID=6339 RepID=A0A183FIV6_HELPZ|nr:unnamed protein product [Heligmosomoides polygyrus]
MVRTALLNALVLAFALEISMCEMHRVLVVQSLPMTRKKKASIEANRRMTTREMAGELDTSNSTVCLHLQQHGDIDELDVWVPHELKEIPPHRTYCHLRGCSVL